MRTHNEYFRRVFVRQIHGEKTRPPELVDEILAREGCTLSRDLLEKPYKTIVGEESRRKSCPHCGTKLEPDEWVWSWGEYVNAKWNTVMHFCKTCFPLYVKDRLLDHRNDCGCDFNLIAYGGDQLPDWLLLPPNCSECEDQKAVPCPECNGEGYNGDLECRWCHGDGAVACDECS